MKYISVNVWHYIKEINVIFVSVITCSVAGNLIVTSTWRRRNKYYSVLIQKYFLAKETSTYWKLKDNSLSCFKYQSTIVFLSCEGFFH